MTEVLVLDEVGSGSLLKGAKMLTLLDTIVVPDSRWELEPLGIVFVNEVSVLSKDLEENFEDGSLLLGLIVPVLCKDAVVTSPALVGGGVGAAECDVVEGWDKKVVIIVSRIVVAV